MSLEDVNSKIRDAGTIVIGAGGIAISHEAIKTIKEAGTEALDLADLSSKKITVYHGTSKEQANKILKTSLGAPLRNSFNPNNVPLKKGAKYAFVATSKSVAREYAHIGELTNISHKDKKTRRDMSKIKKFIKGGIINVDKKVSQGKVLKYNLTHNEFKKFKVDSLFTSKPNNRFVKQGTLSNKHLASKLKVSEMVANFKNAPKKEKLAVAKKLLKGKAALATGLILTGAAAYSLWKKDKKGTWVSSKGRKFLIRDKK